MHPKPWEETSNPCEPSFTIGTTEEKAIASRPFGSSSLQLEEAGKSMFPPNYLLLTVFVCSRIRPILMFCWAICYDDDDDDDDDIYTHVMWAFMLA